MKSEILKLLRNTPNYISGQELCEHFNVSRTAIWKYINQLKDEGYEIEAVRNKGYCITKYPDVVTDVEIESILKDEYYKNKIKYYDVVESTNKTAKQLAEEGCQAGTVVIANEQTAGKGRRGRVWTTPKNSSIALSIVLRPEISTKSASMLTLVAGMAVNRTVNSFKELEGKIKWPNDIVINNKKICGILTEMSTQIEDINYVIVGIGVNVNVSKFPEELKDIATSMKIESKAKINRAKVVSLLLQNFKELYDIFIETQDMTNLIEEYNNSLININKEVFIINKDKKVMATATGIDKEGRLLVKYPDGTTDSIVSGEVSIRGVYGYV